MKMLLITCSAELADGVRELVQAHNVHGYTELAGAFGAGVTGTHLKTRAFPGEVALLFTAVPDEKAPELVGALREYAGALDSGEGLKVFAMDVTMVV